MPASIAPCVAESISDNDDARLLLPVAVDDIAREDPDFIYALYPKSRDLSDEYEALSYSGLARAVDRVAHFLTRELGKRLEASKVVGYLGPNGPYTTIMFLATMKAGYEIFLPSERNSTPAQLHLFKALDCSILVTPDLNFAAVKAIASETTEIHLLELPRLAEVAKGPGVTFPWIKKPAELRNKVCFIVHTSGSTGFPKPVRIPFEAVSRMGRCVCLPNPAGCETLASILRGRSCINFLPLNHPAGIGIGMLQAILNKFTLILPPPEMPPTANLLAEMVTNGGIEAEWAALAPLTMEQLSKDPSLTQKVTAKLSMMLWSGGGLPKIFGDTLARSLRLVTLLGSSELGAIPTAYPRDLDRVNDWEYISFHPSANFVLDPLGDGTFELVQRRTAEAEPYQVAFMNPANKDEFHTNDLFVPHSQREGLWRHVSRADDVIVLLNGEKVNPTLCESVIASHPKVAGALMFGAQRFEVGVLLELQGDADLTLSQKAVVLDEIWPKFVEANALLPQHGQIDKSHILFTSRTEPILRTLKNTVRRQPTLDLYKSRIEKLYEDVERTWIPKQMVSQGPSLVRCKYVVSDGIKSDARLATLGDNDDFFEAGMDSLQVLRLVRHMRKALGVDAIDPSLVYQSSTIELLAIALYTHSSVQSDRAKEFSEQRLARIVDLKSQHIKILDDLKASIQNLNGCKAKDRATIVLTGSTGYIGRYLLRSLLDMPDIAHVYCLNRAADSVEVQAKRNAATDLTLPTQFDASRVTFLQADLSKYTQLGLNTEAYGNILANATHVLHAAWPVDFNLALSSFSSSLQGTSNLISLCAKSANRARLIFISSVSSTMGLDVSPVPEEIISSPASAAPTGYAESKWIAEQLCQHAATELNVPCTVLRLGQIAGAVGSSGSWNPADWMPALVMSSAYLGTLPDQLSDAAAIRWLPIDVIADVIVELSLGRTSEAGAPLQVYQPLNPRAVNWSDLSGSVADCIEEYQSAKRLRKGVELVEPSEWLRLLRESASEGGHTEADIDNLLDVNPALKLQGHFEARYADVATNGSGLNWSSDKALQRSKRLRDCKEITVEDMQRWVAGWLAKSKP